MVINSKEIPLLKTEDIMKNKIFLFAIISIALLNNDSFCQDSNYYSELADNLIVDSSIRDTSNTNSTVKTNNGINMEKSNEVYFDSETDFLHVNLNVQGTKNSLIEVYTLSGKLIFLEEIEVGKQAFIFSSFPNGEYIAKLLTNEGTQTEKFIIN